MKKILSTALLALACLSQHANAEKLTRYVDPMIGTTNFSVCNPGAVMPHGLMTVTPFNVMGSDLNKFDKDKRWWSAAYEYDNVYMTGFAHVMMSGVGCPEMGTLLTMPTTGKLNVDYHEYGSTYEQETARPGYYGVTLKKYGVKCEMTSTLRSSRERYTFPKGEGHILVNIGDGLTNEVGGSVKRVSDTEVEGFRLLGTFCYYPQAVFPMYFVIRVNKKPQSAGFWKLQPKMEGVKGEWDPDNGKYKLYNNYGRDLAGDHIGCYFNYDFADNSEVEVSVGVSFVSIKNARENLDAEQRGKSFDDIARLADQEWENTLGKITVEGGTEAQKRVFYTALYHTQLEPCILQDVNGEYPTMESDSVGHTSGTRYTVFSLWDTYRNLHQLETLLYPDRQVEMVRSMIDMYREWGWMPRWELFGRETWTMEGDPAIPVITDTWLKGLRDFDINTAYEAFRKSATTPGNDNMMRHDIDPYISRGYIPLGWFAQDQSGDNSVSHALEYYVADASLARLATELGHKQDAKLFRERSLGYKNYYDKQTGTLRPREKDGSWLTPYDPTDGANFSNTPGFHEGSSWNYTFYVPHDISGLAKLMGGSKPFVNRLQSVFDKGYYDPANEPDIAYPYIFSRFKGEEWRTQQEVQKLIAKYYTDKPDGIPGNDDTGTMSAWVVFSMLGLYPDCPGDPSYTLTTPTFTKATLHLDPKYYPNGDIVIETDRTSPSQLYIKSMTLNGKTLNSYRLSHQQLTEGKTLRMTLKK